MTGYPDAPGHRGVDTSIAAADALADKLGPLQNLVAGVVWEAGESGRTGDEIAARLHMERWAVRPRMSELRRKNVIRDSGQRRANLSGRSAIVWIAVVPAEPIA
jgi:hypothetical protein